MHTSIVDHLQCSTCVCKLHATFNSKWATVVGGGCSMLECASLLDALAHEFPPLSDFPVAPWLSSSSLVALRWLPEWLSSAS